MILHVLAAADWAEAREVGEVRPASLAADGFVHCSTADQLPGVVARFYAEVADLVVLTVDPADFVDALRWEPPAHAHEDPGERFPHLYGPLPVAAVRDAVPWPAWLAAQPP